MVSAAALVALASCFMGSQGDLTETGKGKPHVDIEFPAQAQPGSVQEAVVQITNPGPGDIATVAVAFSNVGAVDGQSLPDPIVVPASGRNNPSIVSVDPEPTSVNRGEPIFFFGNLDEGESTEIVFELRVPDVAGLAANSVQVYAAEEPPRGAGTLLRTEVH